MKEILEASKEISILTETDVLVVGSGPAGLAAAISAAREGVKTILLERYGCFGGVLTQVGVEGIAWYRHEGTTDVEGIGIEFEQTAKRLGGTTKDPESLGEEINADMFKVVADNLIRESNVIPLLHCYGVEAILEGNILKGVITESKSGRQAVLAKRTIDATGDADIAHLAGAPHRKTPKNEVMSVTVMFSCAGVDKQRFLDYIYDNPSTYADWGGDWEKETTQKEDQLFSTYLEEPFYKARESGLIPKECIGIRGSWSTITEDGDATNLNMVQLSGFDCTDVWDLTRAEMTGRHHAILAIEALRKYTPGFENARLRNFGMTLGTRDSRKIMGRYNLTDQDVRNQASFEDSIGIFPEFIDGYGVLLLPTTGRYFQVPFGITVPQKIENLLVAGRCVAGDRISHAAMRNMMACTVTGQGVGVASALSIKDGVKSADVNTRKLQKSLQKQGVRLS